MALKIRDKTQVTLIRTIAREAGIPVNQLVYDLVEFGVGMCVLAHKPIVEREEAFKGLDQLKDEVPEFAKASQLIHEYWQAGQEAPQHDNN
jgi:hypothetical protein